MTCFCTQQNDSNCCSANVLCDFNGNLDDVTATPIYVQSVYDAVKFHLQGMKTVQNLKFSPSIPCGFSVNRIPDIRCKKVFTPDNASDFGKDTLRRYQQLRRQLSGRYTCVRYAECENVG